MWDHYRKGEYAQALEAAERINLPDHLWQSAALAAIHAQLGHVEEARTQLAKFVQQAPEISRNPGAEISTFLASEELVDHFLDGLRKAGLEFEGDGESAPEATHKAAPAVAVPSESRQPFVGRQAEYDKLVARLDALAGGTGTLVLLGGEPGVGKTRLSEELLAEARQRGMVVLTGHCYEEGQTPFAPFVEMLEQLLREMPADVLRQALGEDAADLARLVPKIRVVLDDVPDPAVLEPEQQRRVLFNAVLDLFRRLSVRQPVVMLLDDLHWADEATVGLLQHLTPHLSSMPLLGLGTYRDVELDVGKPFEKAMATLVRQKQAVRMSVRRLPETAVAELLTALGGSEPPASLIEAIFQETEGNPFFVGEVFQHLSEEGKLFEVAEAGVWKSNLTVDEFDVPEGVRLVVGRRLEHLSDATPTLLTAAAVIGRRFDLRLVDALSGLDDDAFLAAIEEAEAAKLIASERAGRETTCVFTHELVRSTLLAGLSLPRRQRLHAKVAETMEAVYATDLTTHASAMARHLYEAGAAADETKTVRYLTLAANQALETGAFEGALSNVDLALSLVPDADQARRADLLWTRGLARRSLGWWQEAIVDWETSLGLFETLGDLTTTTAVCQELAHLHLWNAQPTRGVATARRGLEALGPEASPDRCRLLGHLGWTLSSACDVASADHTLRDARAMAETLGEPALLGEMLLLSSWHYQYCLCRGNMADAARRAVELLRPTRALGKLAGALANLQWSSVLIGRPEEVAHTEDETAALGERLGLLDTQMIALISTSLRDWMGKADLEAYDAYVRRLLTLTEQAGGGWVFSGEAWHAQTRLWQGRPQDARDRARASADHEPHGTVNTGMGWGMLFLCHCWLRDRETALVYLDRWHGGLPRTGTLHSAGSWDALFKVIEGLAMVGERDRAAELYPLMLEAIATGTVVTWDAGHLLETLAGIAAAAGWQWDAAEAHYQTALRLADEIPFISEQAEARYWYARMLVDRDASGDRDRAAELLETALTVYRKIGMPWHVERAEKLVGEASG